MENIEQKAIAVLDAIAQKLGTGVDHFWPLAVKEQWISGVMGALGGLIALTLAFASYRLMRNHYRKVKEKEGDRFELSDTSPEIVIVCCIVILFFGLGGIITLAETLPILLNPEYHALKAVLEMVK